MFGGGCLVPFVELEIPFLNPLNIFAEKELGSHEQLMQSLE